MALIARKINGFLFLVYGLTAKAPRRENLRRDAKKRRKSASRLLRTTGRKR
jgi:hypothetical protein